MVSSRLQPRRRVLGVLLALAAGVFAPTATAGERITVAAASDLKFALDEIVAEFGRAHPGDVVEVVYGSSGKFATQIRQGAPFDLYFSADIAYPRALEAEGLALGPTRAYAVGRIVLWSNTRDARALRLQDLADPALGRIAIANPRHAPYGKRAEEALRAAGVWEAVQPRLVQGENIAQAFQFVATGNAQLGFVALSQVMADGKLTSGSAWQVPASLHDPIRQDAVLLTPGKDSTAAAALLAYLRGDKARAIIRSYGYGL